MTAALGNFVNGAFNTLDGFVYPQFLFDPKRPPTVNDIFPAGTRWLDNSANPKIIYETTGAGEWDTGGVQPATTALYGTVLLTDNSQPVATKAYADALAIAGAPAWSETVSGIGQLSTNAEAIAGVNDDTAMTPLKVAAALAAGLPITGGAGSFTTLAASGLASLSGSATITTGATALNLASDASTGAVNIATGAGARVVTIGNVTGASQIVLNSGTAGIQLVSTGAGDITLASSDTLLLDSAGVLELNSSAAAINIGNDAVAQAINIGTGAAARTITLGNSTGATSLVLNSGTGAINVGTNAIAHTITLGNSTGATSLVLDAGTGPINVGTNAIAHVVTIGNVTGATGVAINVGTGNFVLNGVAGSTYAIGAASTTGTITIGGTVQTGTISIGQGTGAQTVNLATGGTGVKTVNIATGAIGNIVTIGSVTAAASMSLLVGTGNFSLDGAATSTYTFAPSTTSGTINFGGTGANTGTMTIAGGTGAQTINVANSTGDKTIAIGTGAAANVITIGTTNSTASLNLQSGSGNVSVTGGHLAIASVAKTLLVNGGAVTDFIGTGVLTLGTVVIANTNIATNDVIILCRTAVNLSTTLGELTYTISNGVSFTVTSVILGTPGSTQTGDLSSFAYFIVRPT